MNNDPQDEPLMNHEVDGIRELDNLLPRWWVWLFHFTVIFSVIYIGYYHVFHAGNLQAAEYDKDFKSGEAVKSAAIKKFEDSLATLEPSTEKPVLSQGTDIFLRNCAPCHRVDGGGLVGPNLCDDFWIHGGKFEDSLKTIWNGVPEKGMVTWRGVLKPDEIKAVASYIYTFRGTTPPNPKPPENQTPQPAAPSIFE